MYFTPRCPLLLGIILCLMPTYFVPMEPPASGANVNACKNDGNALHDAIEIGRLDLVRQLLISGADYNQRQQINKQRTPLHHAVGEGLLEIVRALIAYGADIDASDEDKTSPLQTAILRGNASIARELLMQGARYNVSDLLLPSSEFIQLRVDLNNLEKAVLCDEPDTVKQLIHAGKFSSQVLEQALVLAAAQRKLSIVQLFFEHIIFSQQATEKVRVMIGRLQSQPRQEILSS